VTVYAASYTPSSDLATSVFHFFGPLKKTWLASDLQQTPMLSKLPSPGNMLHTNVFYARIQALVSWWNKCLYVHGQQIVQPNLHIVTAAI